MNTSAPQPTTASVWFRIMCVLTILGGVFLVAVNLLKIGLLESGIRQGGIGADAIPYFRMLLLGALLTSAGAGFGALMMLGGRLLGFRIYAVSTVLHIGLTFCAMLIWAATIYLMFISAFLFLYCLLLAGCLLYFWRNRAHLR